MKTPSRSRLASLALAVAATLLAACSPGVASTEPSNAALPPAATVSAPPTGPVSAAPASPEASAAPAAPEASNAPDVAPAAVPTVAQLIGQKLVVRMDGTTPSASILRRIRRGEVGGVILFKANIVSKTQLRAVTKALQGAATAGGQPRLLVCIDQEGGVVKRISWAPPTRSAPQMGADGRTSVAQAQGAATGDALAGLGINVDFAPVVDVPGSTASFMYRDGRTWAFSAARTARLANAFAEGLRAHGVLPAFKHFPGIGLASKNTDKYVVKLTASAAALDPGLAPYRTAIAKAMPLVMLSNATYTAWDSKNAAGWSRSVISTLLRSKLGFRGVTITDSLDGTAGARKTSSRVLAVRAARAGADMILITGAESTSLRVYADLLAGATAGTISRSLLTASYERILAMKADL